MKVPSAIDRPSVSINSAEPSTSNSAAAVKISRTPEAAIQRNSGRSREAAADQHAAERRHL